MRERERGVGGKVRTERRRGGGVKRSREIERRKEFEVR